MGKQEDKSFSAAALVASLAAMFCNFFRTGFDTLDKCCYSLFRIVGFLAILYFVIQIALYLVSGYHGMLAESLTWFDGIVRGFLEAPAEVVEAPPAVL